MEGAAFARRARLVNIGQGVARSIGVNDIVIDRSMELRGHRELTHLAAGDTAVLPFHVWVSVATEDPISEVPMEDHGWNVANALDKHDLAVVVSYASLTGQWYQTTIRMTDGTPRTPRIIDDRRIAAPPGAGGPSSPANTDGSRRAVGRNPGVSTDTLRAAFGTVAQTLAAILAILIAIVVIRLPAIEHDVDTAKLYLRAFEPFKSRYEQASRAFLSEGVEGLRKANFDVDSDWPNKGKYLEAGYRAWVAWGRLIPAVWIAVCGTFGVVALCLVTLALVEHIAR